MNVIWNNIHIHLFQNLILGTYIFYEIYEDICAKHESLYIEFDQMFSFYD